MTELENDINRQGSKTELSRARQRKLKVERTSGESPQVDAGSNRHNPAHPRASRRSGPSVREKLAATPVNILTPSFQSLQGKLSSKFGRVTRPSTIDQTTKKIFLSGAMFASRNSHNKSETQRDQNRYEATASAETQRKPKNDQPFIARKNRRIYDARSETVPPVMVRGGMGGMAFGRSASSRLHKQKVPKRRFDVPLKVQGAEVRLPSIPLIHIGWRAVSLLMVLMMTTSLFLIWKSPVFQVQSVEAKGLKRLTLTELNTVMGTLGTSVFTINPQVLEKNLQLAFPELENISVRVNLPASVKVSVIERVPLIAWNQSGSEVWVDAQGVAFPPRGNPEKELVRVEGHGTPPGFTTTPSTNDLQNPPTGLPSAPTTTIPKISLSPDLVSGILVLGAKMPADTLLAYDSEHGLGWNDPNGWEVFFGAEDQDIEMKLSVYQAMVDRLQSEGIQPALISVEYVHAPYYRMER